MIIRMTIFIQLGCCFAIVVCCVVIRLVFFLRACVSAAAANAQHLYNSLQTTVGGMWTPQNGNKKKTHYGAAFIREIRLRLDSYFSLMIHNLREIVRKRKTKATPKKLEFVTYKGGVVDLKKRNDVCLNMIAFVTWASILLFFVVSMCAVFTR